MYVFTRAWSGSQVIKKLSVSLENFENDQTIAYWLNDRGTV